ncbi:MAG TPA: zinc ribbon domain-containing protein [Candidatus Limnocylindrales bacterium]|nr:zinc ribbon domain-containing protein [Candidatus Limnocylindrales bacterium]
MEQILAQIGDTIGGIFSSPFLQLGVRAVGVYLVILWLASAYWAFRDMQQRSDNAILPYLVAAGIILFTPLFFVLAVWVYKIVRPHEKIGEVWERNLAEEALLAEVESIRHCPGCERRVDEEWIICPTCRTRLNRVCPNCSRLVGLDWSLCAWCGKDFERRPIAAASLEPLPGAHDATGRIAASAVGETAPRAAAAATPPIRTTVRTASSTSSRASGSSRSSGSARAAGGASAAQDPLPER